MERVNAVLGHPAFTAELERLSVFEKGRVFCGHDINHLLDVARLAYIRCLEAGERVEKELIYAAALLHDIGRSRQYEDGTPHELESARIAAEILPECGFGEKEIVLIVDAIMSHRSDSGEMPGFAGLLFRADKLSRRCFDCAANLECDWSMKNTRLEY